MIGPDGFFDGWSHFWSVGRHSILFALGFVAAMFVFRFACALVWAFFAALTSR